MNIVNIVREINNFKHRGEDDDVYEAIDTYVQYTIAHDNFVFNGLSFGVIRNTMRQQMELIAPDSEIIRCENIILKRYNTTYEEIKKKEIIYSRNWEKLSIYFLAGLYFKYYESREDYDKNIAKIKEEIEDYEYWKDGNVGDTVFLWGDNEGEIADNYIAQETYIILCEFLCMYLEAKYLNNILRGSKWIKRQQRK